MSGDARREELFRSWQKQGERAALGELLLLELEEIKRGLRARSPALGDFSLSDVAQSAARRVLSGDAAGRLPDLEDAASLRNYLWAVARHRLLDLLRKRRAGTTLEALGTEPGDPEALARFERIDQDDALFTAIELLELPEERQLALRIAAGERQRDLVPRLVEAGEAPSEAAARMRILRVRKQLAARLKSFEERVLEQGRA